MWISCIDSARKGAYSFSYPLLKKVYRNSSHDKLQQDKVLTLLSTQLRKTSDAQATVLSIPEKVRLLCYLGLLDDGLKLAEGAMDLEPDLVKKGELQAWIAYIHSEKSEHADALLAFQKVPPIMLAQAMFREAQAKSLMNTQRYAEAAGIYLGLVKRNPTGANNYRHRWYYFWNLLASGDIKGAGDFMANSHDEAFSDTDFRRDASIYWEGRTMLSSGNLDGATKQLEPLLIKANPSYYSLSAKAALTQAQAVFDKKNNEQGQVAGLSPVYVSFHAKDLSGPRLERSDRIPFASYVHEIAKDMDIDAYLILAIMRSESAFNSRALSQAGAQGLMQLMPYTAVRLSRLFDDSDFKLDQLQTADTNITYGSLYLSLLLHYYGGHEIPAVAAYNAGPTVVNKWLKECHGCPNDALLSSSLYGETRNYVKKVMSIYTTFRQQETSSSPTSCKRNCRPSCQRPIAFSNPKILF